MKTPLIFAIALAACAVATSADARMYKWVDEDGQTHYTQTPPPEADKDYQSVEPPPPPPVSAEEASARHQKLKQNLQEDLQAEEKAEEEREKEKEKAEQQAQRCDKAKRWLRQLEASGRIREVDEDGNYNYLGDKQRQARIDKAKGIVQKECGN